MQSKIGIASMVSMRSSLNLSYLLLLSIFIFGLLGVKVSVSDLFGSFTVISTLGWQWSLLTVLVLYIVASLGRVIKSKNCRSVSRSSETVKQDTQLGKSLDLELWFARLAILYLFTDLPQRKFSYYAERFVCIDIFVLAVLAYFVSRCFVSAHVYLRSIFNLRNVIIIQLALLLVYYQIANGKILFCDDHPSFLYRLYLLKTHFPYLPFYNTDWNAGYNAREFFPSGVLNIFSLLSPFIYMIAKFDNLENLSWYSMVPFIIMVIISPLSTYLSGRLFCMSRASSALAAILVLYPSSLLFEWLFKYGTLGFVTSCVLMPLVFGLIFRIVFLKSEQSWWHLCALLVVSSLVLFWTLSVVVFLPIVILVIARLISEYRKGKILKRMAIRKRILKLLVFGLVFFAINIPWILIFVKESRVVDFVKRSSLPGVVTSSDMVRDGVLAKIIHSLGKINESLIKINPLILFLFIPSLIKLPRTRIRRDCYLMLVITVIWLFCLAIIGEGIKPQLELKRMVLVASVLMCIPVANTIRSVLLQSLCSFKRRYVIIGAFLYSMIAFVPIKLAESLVNKAPDKYRFADHTVADLVDTIKANADSGRVFFSGFLLHELNSSSVEVQDGGHVAPLAMLIDSQLYASDFYHAKWAHADPVPSDYRSRGEDGIEEFLDLVNATLVIAHLQEWKDYFTKTPGYERVKVENEKRGRFYVFKRKRATNNYFMEGSGLVKRATDGLEVLPKSEKIILKYRYQPNLKVEADNVELFPVPVFRENMGGEVTSEVRYIGLKLTAAIDQNKWVKISYR